ncbi:MAG TPA: hypothetical protein PKK99_03300 [Bacteroidia bacterium]|nr:hypothetical protein [Bacteroidia bacterium]
MIFSKINLQSELTRERSKQQRLLNEIYDILEDAKSTDEEILDRLQSTSAEKHLGIRISEKDKDRIFSIEEIKTICIRYRLRFLDSHYFRSEYPYEALVQIKQFEKDYRLKIGQFKIIAPDHTFNLENINKDPLLFAQLNDQTFYLIHQWGEDLAWYKRIVLWPLQNFRTYLISLFLIATAFACILPSSIMNIWGIQSEFYLRAWLTLHTFIGIFGLSLWIGISFDKSFSSMSWNSRYFNY